MSTTYYIKKVEEDDKYTTNVKYCSCLASTDLDHIKTYNQNKEGQSHQLIFIICLFVRLVLSVN